MVIHYPCIHPAFVANCSFAANSVSGEGEVSGVPAVPEDLKVPGVVKVFVEQA